MELEVIRVLMIEDSPDAVRLVREELKDAQGDKFELACEGRLSEGLERIEKGNIDVILLDLSLPDSQGYDTFAQVHLHTPNIPIVVLSGDNNESLAVKTVQAGAQDYLIKGEWSIGRTVRSIYYAIERQRTMDALRSVLFVDKLTGLRNRGGLFILAEQQMNIANRTKSGLFVIFVDLNDMKMINDTMGHQEGDHALIEAASIFKETFRTSDIIARIGGDEFVIISIETHKGRAADIIEARLRENIRIHNAERSRRYKLSMSVGISYYDPENPVSFNELLSSADKKMYEQKRDVNESSL